MPKFNTQFDPHDRVYLEPGSPVKQLYAPHYDDQGRWYLEEAGTEDLYGYIQSHAMSVDINVLLKQYQLGDINALQRVQGTYGDFTQAPKTFAEALNVMIAAEQYFMSLPVEARAQFNHNFSEFIAAMDSPDWMTKAGITPPDPEPTNIDPGANPLHIQPTPTPVEPSSPVTPSPASSSSAV